MSIDYITLKAQLLHKDYIKSKINHILDYIMSIDYITLKAQLLHTKIIPNQRLIKYEIITCKIIQYSKDIITHLTQHYTTTQSLSRSLVHSLTHPPKIISHSKSLRHPNTVLFISITICLHLSDFITTKDYTTSKI